MHRSLSALLVLISVTACISNVSGLSTPLGPSTPVTPSAPVTPESTADAGCTADARGGQVAGEGTRVALTNGNFANGLTGWTRTSGTISVSRSLKSPGAPASLHVVAASGGEALVRSASIPLTGTGMYELHGAVHIVVGADVVGLAFGAELYAGSTRLAPATVQTAWVQGANSASVPWRRFSTRFYVPPGADTLVLRLFTPNGGPIDVSVSDLSLWHKPAGAPWTSQYARSRDEHCKLTADDVVGPDGRVYPRWTSVGVQLAGGIPNPRAVFPVHATANAPDVDVKDALDAAIEQATHADGGVVLLDEGTYYLKRPVEIHGSNVVLRGRGQGRTHLLSLVTASLPAGHGVITFLGDGQQGEAIPLAADAHRGDTSLVLADTTSIHAGTKLFLTAPPGDRWNVLVNNTCPWSGFRTYEVLVDSVDGHTVRLTQPLRLDFPTEDGSYVKRVSVLEANGIEDMEVKQQVFSDNNLVMFTHTWNCWAQRVTFTKPGSMGLYHAGAKWCDVRAVVVNDAWNKGGGGQAYVGFDGSWDNLMEDVTTYNLRHAPLFNWGASGNVVRNSVFHGSDAQWHSGWTHENLVEGCTIEATTKANGGYGKGFFGTDPGDGIHGPTGPRNVVYNNDVSSLEEGVSLGGSTESFLILFNRFRVHSGPGVRQRATGFDHVIAGNSFVLEDATAPMVSLDTPDSTGVLLEDNLFSSAADAGVAPWVRGPGDAVLGTGNQRLPRGTIPARPSPAVPSIYQWELAHAQP